MVLRRVYANMAFFLPAAARMQHADAHKIRFHAKCSLHTNQFWFLSYNRFFFMLFSLFIRLRRTRRQSHWCSSCNSCNISCMYVIIFACNHVWVAYDRLLTAVNQNRHCWLQLFSRKFLEFISSQGDFQGYIYILATQMTDNCCDTRAA